MKVGKINASETEFAIIAVAAAFVVYMLYKGIKAAPAAIANAPAATVNAAGNAIGSTLDAIGSQLLGSSTYNSIPNTWGGVWNALTGGGSNAGDAVAQDTQGVLRDQVVTPNYIDDISGSVGGAGNTQSSLDSSYDFGLGTQDGSDGAWT